MAKRLIVLLLAAVSVTIGWATQAQMASTRSVGPKPSASASQPSPAPVLSPDAVRDLLLLQRQVLRQAVTIQSLLAQIKETDLYKQYDDASQKQALTQQALTDRTTAILTSLSLDPAKWEIDLDTFAIREKAASAAPSTLKK